eukprot:7270252-Alexandrium_andersonii.AAC.1
MQLLPGELAYFYRKQARRAKNGSGRRGQPMLNQWHGPAMAIGHEGRSAVYLGYHGGVAKCAPEAVRRASAVEQLTAEDWGDAL